MEKVVIVGATSGIGKYLAELYAKFDSQIAIICRREDKLKEIAATDSVKYIYKTCDISQIDTLLHVLDEIATLLGALI